MKWVEAAKEGQDYVLSAELKEKRDTIEAEAAEVLKKSGATPCTLYGIADGSPVVSSVEIGIKDGEDYMLLHPCARWRKVAEFKLLKMLPCIPNAMAIWTSATMNPHVLPRIPRRRTWKPGGRSTKDAPKDMSRRGNWR